MSGSISPPNAAPTAPAVPDTTPSTSASTPTSNPTPLPTPMPEPANAHPAPNPAKGMVQFSRWLAVASLLGLIVLGLAWELVLAPLRPGGSWLALKVLPLCIPLAGLLKNRLYTYRWVSLVVWLYFIEGVVRGYSDKPPGNLLGWLEVLLCLTLFTACTLHVRTRLGPRKPTPREDSQP